MCLRLNDAAGYTGPEEKLLFTVADDIYIHYVKNNADVSRVNECCGGSSYGNKTVVPYAYDVESVLDVSCR